MSQNLLNLTITRVDGPVFDGPVVSVVVPGLAGQMELYAHHEALISPLKTGEIRIKREDGTEQVIEIKTGTLEVSDNHATVLI